MQVSTSNQVYSHQRGLTRLNREVDKMDKSILTKGV